LFSPADLDNVWAIQDHFRVQPLSQYRKTYLPEPAPDIKWIKPLDVRREPTALHFFAILNWMLQYMPVLPEEQALRKKLETIGVKPAHQFEVHDKAAREALVQGMQLGLQTMQAALGKVRSSGELFGSREFLGSNYVSRAVGAMVGILGNAREEYLGIGYQGENGSQFFDGRHAYQIKFGPHDLPPVKAFWSITVYDGSMLLYDNPLHRHVINSPLVDQLVKDADGGFTLYVQHESPGHDKEANWLPVPRDKFNLTFRCYQPEEAILNFTYGAPPVVKVQ
jgi:hypothetical protein